MTKIYQSVNELVGHTPIVKLNHIVEEGSADVYLKLEFFNPGGSVKDRIALAMIEKAEKNGLLKAGDTIIEPTSGNTGIGLAMIGTAKGYRVVLVMPETMSIERRKIVQAYGAELILTPGSEGITGSINKAKELAEQDGYYMPLQFENPANPNLKIVGVEPAESAILGGGKPGPHKIQGIGTGFVPKVLDTEIYDQVIAIASEDAMETARQVGMKEGILVGISSGAAIKAALEVAKDLGKGKKVLAIVPDNGERYLSTALYQFED